MSAHALLADQVSQNLLANKLWVAVVALIHQQIFTFLTGASTLVVVSEAISLVRGEQRHERLAHGILRGMAYVFGVGSAVPIFWVLFVFLGLWGTFFIALTRITFWVFVVEACLFLAEIVLLYTVYANWDRLRLYRRARLGLLVLLNVVLFWQMFAIDIVASYMLTPNGGDTSQIAQTLNPTQLPLTLHRTVGNIAYAGALVAAFAAVRALLLARRDRRRAAAHLQAAQPARSVGAMSATWHRAERRPELADQGAPDDRAFYDWVVQWGVMFALGFTLLQPWIGYSYAKEVQLHAYPAWFDMMFGDLSNVFLVQITLLGLIFILATHHLSARMRANGVRRGRWVALATFLVWAGTLLAAMPARFTWTQSGLAASGLDKPWWQGGLANPIGTMIPNKIIALLAMMAGGLIVLTVYLTALSRSRIRWGVASSRLHWQTVALCLTITSMMIVMGIIREHSRGGYVIYGEITTQGQKIVNGPVEQPRPNNPGPGGS